jgi:hypothetical protein
MYIYLLTASFTFQCRFISTDPLISRSERLLAKSHSPRGKRRRKDDLLAVQSNLLNAIEVGKKAKYINLKKPLSFLHSRPNQNNTRKEEPP